MTDINSTTKLHNFGVFMWEAARKFTFIRVSAADSIISEGNIQIQFTVMKGGKAYTHTEMFGMMEIHRLNDPKVVVDAIYQKMEKEWKVR